MALGGNASRGNGFATATWTALTNLMNTPTHAHGAHPPSSGAQTTSASARDTSATAMTTAVMGLTNRTAQRRRVRQTSSAVWPVANVSWPLGSAMVRTTVEMRLMKETALDRRVRWASSTV